MTAFTSTQEPHRPDRDSIEVSHGGQSVPPYTGLQSPSHDGTDTDESDTDSSESSHQESVNIVVNRETHIRGHREALYIPQNNVRELVHNSMDVAHAYANANRNSRGRRRRINLTINANVTVNCNNTFTTTDIELYREMTGSNNAPPQPAKSTTLKHIRNMIAQLRCFRLPKVQIRRQPSILGHIKSLRRASQSNSAGEGADAIRQFLNAYPAPSPATERNGSNNDNDDDLYSSP